MIPPVFHNAPELLPGLDFYFIAFQALNSCRSIGMSLGPIPWTAIVKYGEMHCDSEQGIQDLVHHIRAMDSKFLELANKSTPDPTPNNSGPGR